MKKEILFTSEDAKKASELSRQKGTCPECGRFTRFYSTGVESEVVSRGLLFNRTKAVSFRFYSCSWCGCKWRVRD